MEGSHGVGGRGFMQSLKKIEPICQNQRFKEVDLLKKVFVLFCRARNVHFEEIDLQKKSSLLLGTKSSSKNDDFM